MATAEKQDQNSLEDYLQAPRKKRKKFVVLAFSRRIHRSMRVEIEEFVKKNFPQLNVSHPKSMKDLKRHLSRPVTFAIVDDKFSEVNKLLKAVKDAKSNRKDGSEVPVLFFTENQDELVNAYRDQLGVSSTIDDFCHLGKADTQVILGRIRLGITHGSGSLKKPISIATEGKMLLSNTGEYLDCQLRNLTMFGGDIDVVKDIKFKHEDQMQIIINIPELFPFCKSEFMSLFCRVDRVAISGSSARVKFDHLTDEKKVLLARFLTSKLQDAV